MIEIAEYTISLGLNATVYLTDSETKSTLHIRQGVAKQIAEAIGVMAVRGDRRVRILALEDELARLWQEEAEEKELLSV